MPDEAGGGESIKRNIMVLCPNHHRQAHYGSFEVIEERATDWIAFVDSERLRIERTDLA